MPDGPETERLRAVQDQRAKRELEAADQASEDDERQIHERRADKAAYLRDRLDEQSVAPDE